MPQHDADDSTTNPVEASRASSPADMDVEATDDDEAADSSGTQPSPSTRGTVIPHPPMVFAPERASTPRAEEGKGSATVHPPMLPADVACEMAARKAELQVAAVLEGASTSSSPSVYLPTLYHRFHSATHVRPYIAEDAHARRRRSYATSSASRSRLRRYNPDYLLAARRWRASTTATTTTTASPLKPVLGLGHSRSPSLDAWPHDFDFDTSLETSTLVDPTSPSPFTKHLPAYIPCDTTVPSAGGDWEARLLMHRASLANLRRAAVDAERSWALVEALVKPVVTRRGGFGEP